MNTKICKIILFLFFLLFSGIGFFPIFGQTDPASNSGMVVLKNIPYVTDGQIRQQLDLYLPEDYETAEKPYPLILIVHGGSWTSGNKDDNGFMASWLVPRGYIVAINNYRFLRDAFFPAQLQDCKSAVRWLKANADTYRIDKTRFGAYGASAGGQLVCMLGATPHIKEFDVGEHLEQSSDIQVVANLFGVTCFVELLGARAQENDVPLELFGKRYLGPDVENVVEVFQLLSPVTHAKTSVPTIIMHGTDDEVVPYEQSTLYVKALKEVGVDCELITVPDGKHTSKGFFTPEIISQVEAFYAKYLK